MGNPSCVTRYVTYSGAKRRNPFLKTWRQSHLDGALRLRAATQLGIRAFTNAVELGAPVIWRGHVGRARVPVGPRWRARAQAYKNAVDSATAVARRAASCIARSLPSRCDGPWSPTKSSRRSMSGVPRDRCQGTSSKTRPCHRNPSRSGSRPRLSCHVSRGCKSADKDVADRPAALDRPSLREGSLQEGSAIHDAPLEMRKTRRYRRPPCRRWPGSREGAVRRPKSRWVLVRRGRALLLFSRVSHPSPCSSDFNRSVTTKQVGFLLLPAFSGQR